MDRKARWEHVGRLSEEDHRTSRKNAEGYRISRINIRFKSKFEKWREPLVQKFRWVNRQLTAANLPRLGD
ncbi:hypothetical protein GW17_00042449 [Ensete ventricosum]|nr:hypothetical protein GW17_00042449 [Ensete ventricosum]